MPDRGCAFLDDSGRCVTPRAGHPAMTKCAYDTGDGYTACRGYAPILRKTGYDPLSVLPPEEPTEEPAEEPTT